jgi:hypothetical protein
MDMILRLEIDRILRRPAELRAAEGSQTQYHIANAPSSAFTDG